MAGNRFPDIPAELHRLFVKTSKAVLMETLYDLSELSAKTHEERNKWMNIQIGLRILANEK